MKTPFGQECKFYYQDYYRGRETQECRLLAANPQSPPWKVGLCQACPVPGVLFANDCPNLLLQARVQKGWFGLTQRVLLRAACKRFATEVEDPHIGCGHCAEEAEARRRNQDAENRE